MLKNTFLDDHMTNNVLNFDISRLNSVATIPKTYITYIIHTHTAELRGSLNIFNKFNDD